VRPSELSTQQRDCPVPIPRGWWAFVPPPLPPSLAWTPRLVAALAEAPRARGVLVEVTGRERHRGFAASEILHVVAGPEPDDGGFESG
jgi:hypothetical protein